MSWTFRKMSRGEMNADPIEGEFFTPEGLADSLVRESIQNSLDARRNGEAVRVRFHLSDENGLSQSAGRHYLRGLWPHLQAIESGRANLPAEEERVSFLVIEDFGTRGLCGSTEQDADDDSVGSARYKDFFYFWRNIGRSRKQDTERGRWGLGKTVFPATSRVNSFFGLTVRFDDCTSFLMGQSVLKIHTASGNRYCPYGFFANTDKDEFQRPFDDADVLHRFRTDFQLERRDEPGLSVVVPFPDRDEIDPNHMIRSAILHYFYPIIRRELVVDVSGGGNNVRIDSASIDSIASNMNWSDTTTTSSLLQNLFALVRRSVSTPENSLLVLPEPNPPRAPDWNTGRFTPEITAAIKAQFAANGLLAIRVPVTVRQKRHQHRTSYFDVFVEQDLAMPRADDHYIRQGITISKMPILREKGFRGIVVVTHDALSTLLGDSENPAHTEWIEKSPKLKERFDWGPYTVRFVRQALVRIVAQLLHIPEGRDNELLKSIFFIQDDSEPGEDRSRKKGKKKPDDDNDKKKIVRNPSAFEIDKTIDGFRIKRAAKELPLPTEIDVEVAYEVRRGNPFKKYEKFDFDLQKKPVVVSAEGAEWNAIENNLSIRPKADDFVVEVTGFDPQRDLAIRTKRKKKKEEVDSAQEI